MAQSAPADTIDPAMSYHRSMLMLIALALPAAVFAADCEGLARLSLPQTTLTAKTVPAGSFTPPNGRGLSNLPAFCQVHGVSKPTEASVIHFEVWLPVANWNGKLQGIGNGGLAGTISFAPMANALRNGYAAASTDTGHTTQEPKTWLENRERLIDYSYRGLHLTTEHAKAIIDAYYSKAPKQSYYLGCSKGGQQGLMEAQRYPADYDGIVAGDAANNWTRQMMNEVWIGESPALPKRIFPRRNFSSCRTRPSPPAMLSTASPMESSATPRAAISIRKNSSARARTRLAV